VFGDFSHNNLFCHGMVPSGSLFCSGGCG